MLWLAEMGAEIAGFALTPEDDPNLFDAMDLGALCRHRIGDVRDSEMVASVLAEFRPEIVLHMAAQALVLKSYREPLDTFTTNVIGTANLLEACRGSDSVRVVISVTTDKVYENRATGKAFDEEDRLGGEDPYSASKAAAELVTHTWRTSFLARQGIVVAAARAGNVIGGGDFCANRIIPDAVRAFARGEKLVVRNPGTVRPWQHVADPLAGYLLLAESCWSGPDFAEAWNFGPDPEQLLNVAHIADRFCAAWQGALGWESAPDPGGPHEAGLLLLDSTKARTRLGWRPNVQIDAALVHTAGWYQTMLSGGSAAELRRQAWSAIATREHGLA